ncbi:MULTISPECIES: cupin domain-containing protein [unclassified Streptomyces]|uniref:cupin domain-containing protein n=1 Tax=unclassified Streptomyces TaxID=2593676 RepID=UPI0029AC7414|nr:MULTISPECIES: cupin domain-containing protein [unclassified Streptomyces]MDX3772059.1 cupin domain-containing protein [Streptomyces sp. AK08-01B]MDX3821584.1 cupin domain-containing protein [Streptomyces sp. AK08-01A]
MNNWGVDGWAVAPGEGIRVEPGNRHWLEVMVRGKDVDGALGAFVFTHDVITDNPPHAHHDFMKIMYVLEGHYDFRVGTASFSGGPGTVVVVPKGSQHSFTTATGGRALFVSSPAGNEELFLELGKMGSHPTPEQLAELHTRFRTVGLEEEQASWQQMNASTQSSSSEGLAIGMRD